MTDTLLVQSEDAPAVGTRRVSLAVAAVVAVALLALLAGAVWWFVAGRQAIPDWERLTELDFTAPAGDAFLPETPWVRFQISPARPHVESTVRVSLAAPRGVATPIGTDDPAPRVLALTAQALAIDAAPQTPALTSDASGALTASLRFDRPGWWRLATEVEGAADSAELFLLIPDPNLNGPNAVPGSQSSAEGEALYRRGIETITTLESVRFTQWIADGKGNAAVSEHAVTTGAGDAPPGFSYRAAGGMEAVIIGDTRWIKLPGGLGWQRQEGATVVLPSEWDEEYLGATGFTILGEGTIDGEPCQLLAFVVPELSEPRRQTVAWYLWWVGTESGHVRQEAMVSRLHYMRNQFGDFDAPILLAPPEDAATPLAGTPTG